MSAQALSLNVAMVIPQTEAEGPGTRFALWVQGCSILCEGCCNPEMLAVRERTRWSPEALAAHARTFDVEGVSILGGEPFDQAAGVAAFAHASRADGRSVMVFTGYTLQALRARNDASVNALLDATDLLVDGPYIQDLRTTSRRWVGSTNQQLHHLTTRYRLDDPRFAESNHIEIRYRRGEITLNGWPTHGALTRITKRGQ